MDVRAKQRLCLLACPLNSNELGGGFAPRHLKRYIASRKIVREFDLIGIWNNEKILQTHSI